jgi:glutamate-1-semialdehyde 2,1-aminomutase
MDARIRKTLVNAGVYFFPLSPKQCSISAAHSEADIDSTLEVLSGVLKSLSA